ncbi:metallophosphoesterase [Clostridium sp. AM58-1XD]|uniref:metallophosphoesterase n=1 Tax=Clostridium sp. AM58-1XD TaxID=2292307 RepID=UPI000E46EC8C|nr:metallophosphoesterase [Clostridium sp. AM58-1XD]RGZ00940.1 metallophosphoesterase [Clostridium sp. AM58-1XD]
MWKWIIGAAAAGGIGGLLRSEYEKRHFSVEEYEICSPKIKKDRTAVFLSDLHDQEFGTYNEELLEAIDAVKPDLILIGGDMMVCKGKQSVEIAERLTKQLAKKYPVFYGNGNHELRMRRETDVYGRQYETYRRELKKAGVVYLSDDNAAAFDDIAVAGIDLPEKYYRKFSHDVLKAGDIKRRIGTAERERFQILLAHSPMYFQACREWGADLTLSGHFHGGTIRLPWLGGLMTPQFQFFFPRCAGEFEEEGKKMIVSRGLGTHSIRIRFNNKPQVVVVRMKNKTIF